MIDPELLVRSVLGAAAAGGMLAFVNPAADALFGKAARAIRRRRRRARVAAATARRQARLELLDHRIAARVETIAAIRQRAGR